ncbi:prevent-host-death protein [Tersicoccus phoenicis]|uniref:Prevent-host-death protein n=1 Tax=Tersicoccus phoenicis TaxID=554083 RepID=A0A1R1LCG7_9MICC|nr:prevent-host-death protein [Tersicoccus phoenicis]
MSTTPAAYPNAREGRQHFRDLLDAAEMGVPATVTRDRHTSAVLDAARLRDHLALVCPSRAQVVAENAGWSVLIPGQPLAADGGTFEEAIDEMVLALRDYAEAWIDRLRTAPNHEQNWGLVQLITLSSDDQLASWLTA